MNKTFFLPLILLFFVFYFLVFPVGSGDEVFWKASELYDYREINSVSLPLEKPLLVNQGQYRGVLKPGTGNSFIESGRVNTAYSETHLFRKSGSSLHIENLTNQGVMNIPKRGYPLVLGNHIYSVDFGSASIEEIDEAGRSLWSWQGVSPITSLTVGTGLTVFGSIDGRVRIFTANGTLTELVLPDDNTDQVVYGLALSADNGTLAVVSGLSEQYVRQYRLTFDAPPELIYETLLKDRFRKPVKLLYSREGSYLWVEQEKTVRQFFSGEVNQILTFDGTFLTHSLDEEEGIYYILSRLYSSTGTRYQLTAYTLNGSILMKNQFDEYPEFFSRDDDRIYMSVDEKMIFLSRVES